MPNASLTYCIERQSCERDAKLQKTKNMVRRTILCLCRSESCFHTPSCPLKLSPFAVLVAKDLVVGTCAASLTWAKPMPSRLSKSLTKEKKMCQGTGGGSKLCMWRRKICGSALQKSGTAIHVSICREDEVSDGLSLVTSRAAERSGRPAISGLTKWHRHALIVFSRLCVLAS